MNNIAPVAPAIAQLLPLCTQTKTNSATGVWCDFAERAFYVGGSRITLQSQATSLLLLLCLFEGKVVTVATILQHWYGNNPKVAEEIVKVCLCKLKKKLGPAGKEIAIVWGRGPRLGLSPPSRPLVGQRGYVKNLRGHFVSIDDVPAVQGARWTSSKKDCVASLLVGKCVSAKALLEHYSDMLPAELEEWRRARVKGNRAALRINRTQFNRLA